MKSLDTSPLRSQLKTDILKAKPSTVRYYKRKAEDCVDSLLDMIAPCQSNVSKKDLLLMSDSEEQQDSNLIDNLSKLYLETTDNYCTTLTRPDHFKINQLITSCYWLFL